eukprot:jgi/Mesen1/7891/ME000420S07039
MPESSIAHSAFGVARSAAPAGGGKGNLRFAHLPFDVLHRVLAPLPWASLCAAGGACRAWREASASLREAMLFSLWGKKYRHGRGVSKNPAKALDCFEKASERGSVAAMVDAGLMLWEQGRKGAAVKWYRRAAGEGSSLGQLNLALALLDG